MTKEKQMTIMTPVFKGTRYSHHVCSECNGQLEFEQSCYGGVSFYEIKGVKSEEVKFCPRCGTEIIRFADKPIYEDPIDLSPLDVFAELHREYERKARWLYHCFINEEHRQKIEALIPLIQKDEVSVYYLDALQLARNGRYLYSNNSRTLTKLRKEFGEEQE